MIAQGPFQTGTDDVWPVAEALVVSWLKPNLPGVNIRTETDTTFGTPSPSPSMALPLVLIKSVTSGNGTPASLLTEATLVDVECYDVTRSQVWALYQRVHAWMLRASTQTTPIGTFDDVTLHDSLGVVDYGNKNLRRVITTYGIAARAQGTAS